MIEMIENKGDLINRVVFLPITISHGMQAKEPGDKLSLFKNETKNNTTEPPQQLQLTSLHRRIFLW